MYLSLQWNIFCQILRSWPHWPAWDRKELQQPRKWSCWLPYLWRKLCCRNDKHWDQTTEYFYLYVAPILTTTLSVGLPDRGHLWTKGSGISNFTVHDPIMARVWGTPRFTVFFCCCENGTILRCKNIYNHKARVLHVSAFFDHFQGVVRQRKRKNTTFANYDIDLQLWDYKTC